MTSNGNGSGSKLTLGLLTALVTLLVFALGLVFGAVNRNIDLLETRQFAGHTEFAGLKAEVKALDGRVVVLEHQRSVSGQK